MTNQGEANSKCQARCSNRLREEPRGDVKSTTQRLPAGGVQLWIQQLYLGPLITLFTLKIIHLPPCPTLSNIVQQRTATGTAYDSWQVIEKTKNLSFRSTMRLGCIYLNHLNLGSEVLWRFTKLNPIHLNDSWVKNLWTMFSMWACALAVRTVSQLKAAFQPGEAREGSEGFKPFSTWLRNTDLDL